MSNYAPHPALAALPMTGAVATGHYIVAGVALIALGSALWAMVPRRRRSK